MKNFAIYDQATNIVLRSGFCMPAEFGEIAIIPGENLVELDVLLDWRKTWRIEFIDGAARAVEVAPVETLETRRAKLIERVAERRWQVETGGVLFRGARLETDDRSKLLVTNAARKARDNLNYSVRWKVGKGKWSRLTAADLIAAEAAVFDHAERCFAREAELTDAIDAATEESIDDVGALVEDFDL